jgi:subtilisin-like proprotein convertase family protein
MKKVKTLLLALTIVAGGLASQTALAALYPFTGPDGNGAYTSGTISPSQIIPDNSPVGASYGFNFTVTGLSISAVTLTLNLSGGFNGDMYGYLQHNGALMELFNPGSFSAGGASGTALNLILSSSSATSLSTASAAQLAAGNTYAAAGNLNGCKSADPNGLWTLYFADQSAGDQMTLNSFNLSITATSAVPEPVNVALGIFGGVLAIWSVRRQLKARSTAVTN